MAAEPTAQTASPLQLVVDVVADVVEGAAADGDVVAGRIVDVVGVVGVSTETGRLSHVQHFDMGCQTGRRQWLVLKKQKQNLKQMLMPTPMPMPKKNKNELKKGVFASWHSQCARLPTLLSSAFALVSARTSVWQSTVLGTSWRLPVRALLWSWRFL